MESKKPRVEQEPTPRDISQEFLSMDGIAFLDFLRTLRDEPALSITIDWKDVPTARRLKAFLEDMRAKSRGQKRTATIRATEAEYMQELNVFASGVKWEKKSPSPIRLTAEEYAILNHAFNRAGADALKIMEEKGISYDSGNIVIDVDGVKHTVTTRKDDFFTHIETRAELN